jgi:ribosomal RNA methyltransferase Nop2
MQKQGPPEPLSEAHFARLKRKAGLPVDDVPAETYSKKKRRTSKEITKKNGSTKGGAKTNGQLNGPKSAPAKTNGKKSKTAPTPKQDLEDDISDGLGGGFSGSEVDGDEFTDLVDDGVTGLADDFLDSDGSIYDSDGDKHKAIFSEDEGDSDGEEQLTAANIAGLSRKLDEKLEKEAADAQAELEESALQTNIAGDKPHVLDDDNEDEGIAAKTTALLAPDLQLLRTRISDTIRVLSEFTKLAEDGRSRTEVSKFDSYFALSLHLRSSDVTRECLRGFLLPRIVFEVSTISSHC